MDDSRANSALVLSLIGLVMASAGTGYAASLGDGGGGGDAQAAGNSPGEPVEIQVRNRSRGETGLVTASDGYSLRLSNTQEGGGGGAVYGCRAPDAPPAQDLACLYADNLRGGKAFLFRSRDGASTGHFDLGNPAGAPFTTNATGLVTNLNADKVDGLDATQLQGQQGPAGPQGPPGPAGAPGPSDAFATTTDLGLAWSGGEQVVRSLSLPAGNYIFSAFATADSNSGADQNVSCRITLDNLGIVMAGPVELGANSVLDRQVLSMTAGGTMSSAGLAELRCGAFVTAGDWLARGLTAIKVTSLSG